MRMLVIASILFSQLVSGQVAVSNNEPGVFHDATRELYAFYDNPVTITTGNLRAVKVTAINGTIRKGDGPGKYFIRPTNYDLPYTTTIIITAPDYRKEIEYHLTTMPDPEIYVFGPRNGDSMIENFKFTTGIGLYRKPLSFWNDTSTRIISFLIEFMDSTGEKVRHTNEGPMWDNTTKELIRTSKHKTEVLITKVFVDNGIQKRYLSTYARHIVWLRQY